MRQCVLEEHSNVCIDIYSEGTSPSFGKSQKIVSPFSDVILWGTG